MEKRKHGRVYKKGNWRKGGFITVLLAKYPPLPPFSASQNLNRIFYPGFEGY